MNHLHGRAVRREIGETANVAEIDAHVVVRLGLDLVALHELRGHGGREETIQKSLGSLALVIARFRSLFHQVFQIVCVFLHASEQVVQNVTGNP